MGRADDRADVRIPVASDGVGAPALHQVRCTLVQLLAAGKLQLLQFGARRVGRPYKNEDVLVVRRGCLDERRDAIRAEIRVDGDGILVPGVIQAVAVGDSGQMTGVCGGRGSDVAALDVAEHVQALLLGVFAGHRVCVDPGRADRLIHGDLRLDRGHDVGDRIDDRPVEFEIRYGQTCRGQFGLILDGFPHLVGERIHDLRRDQRRRRIESDDAGVLCLLDGFDQTIHAWCFLSCVCPAADGGFAGRFESAVSECG